jgi:hypothetical protein
MGISSSISDGSATTGTPTQFSLCLSTPTSVSTCVPAIVLLWPSILCHMCWCLPGPPPPRHRQPISNGTGTGIDTAILTPQRQPLEVRVSVSFFQTCCV